MSDAILLLGRPHEFMLRVAQGLQEKKKDAIHNGDVDNTASAESSVHILNIEDQTELERRINDFSQISGVIIFPGWYGSGDFLESTSEDWDEALHQNFYEMVYAGQAIARKLIQQGVGGSIVYLASISGSIPMAETIVQGTTFTMLEALMKMAAVDLAAYQITVNMIAHGWISQDASIGGTFPELRDGIEADIPIGRTIMPGEIARLAEFLLSNAARSMTGSVLTIDGGTRLTKSDATSPYQP